MRKFLVTGSCLVAVVSCGSAQAVDVTLGGSIDLGATYGLGKAANGFELVDSFNEIGIYLQVAGTTDRGIQYAASVSAQPLKSLRVGDYSEAGIKHLIKATAPGHTDKIANVRSVSGGGALASEQLVAVKINSDWLSLGKTVSDYRMPLDQLQASNICKVAGRAYQTATGGTYAGGFIDAERRTTNGAVIGTVKSVAERVAPAFLPAGRLVGAFTNFASVTAGQVGQAGTTIQASIPAGKPNFISLTAGLPTGAPINVTFYANQTLQETRQVSPSASVSVSLTLRETRGTVGYLVVRETEFGATDPIEVTNAEIYAGPFMEVKLASSTTQMAVGAVCVEGIRRSATDYYLQNKQPLVNMGQASVFIEGGFGRGILQTSSYGGTVTAIGGAGNEANISANGVVAILEGAGPLGIRPYVAIDLARGAAPNNIEFLTGGTYFFGGLSASLDVRVLTEAINVIEDWDLGLRYALGRLDLMAATDSENDWGLTASIDIEQFQVDIELASEGTGDHRKDGIYYAFQASTNVGDLSMEAGMDRNGFPTVSFNYPLGALIFYGTYLGASEGGSIGVQFDF